jgi:glutamyl-tRNA reductase
MREQITWPMTEHTRLLDKFVKLPTIHEAALLATCNRTEFYCETSDPSCIVPWLAREHQLDPEAIRPYFYLHDQYHGIRHGLKVACGLDSMMLGEPQILGQMKRSYKQACESGTAKRHLHHVFQYIFSASKQIRHHSGIGLNPVSIAYAAMQLIQQQFPNQQPLRIFLIGSGETCTLIAKYLHKQGVHQFTVSSRTMQGAEQLATTLNGQAVAINDIAFHLAQSDVVISATTCPLPFISKTLVQEAIRDRNKAPLFLLDLAVPRDIEADVATIDAVKLYNIDDLYMTVQQGMHRRMIAASDAEVLLDAALDKYIAWHKALRAREAICSYRGHMKRLANQEQDRAMRALAAGQSQETVIATLIDRLFNKLTHTPTLNLRQAALNNRDDLLDLTHTLFKTQKTTHYRDES